MRKSPLRRRASASYCPENKRSRTPEKPDIALTNTAKSDTPPSLQILNRLNARRQALQREGMGEAEALVSREDLARDRIVVVLGEWKSGIVGLLAGKLCEKHMRPSVVCSDDAGGRLYVGSARSIPAYDISRGIGSCADHRCLWRVLQPRVFL